MLAAAVEAKLDEFTSQVRLRWRDGGWAWQGRCVGGNGGATSACVPLCAPQNMSNAVLAFAKLEYRPPDSCLEGLARTALQRIKTFSPQALSNTLWGLSKLDIKASQGAPGAVEAVRGSLVLLLPWLRVSQRFEVLASAPCSAPPPSHVGNSRLLAVPRRRRFPTNPPRFDAAGGRADGGHWAGGAQPAVRVQLPEPGQLGEGGGLG